MKMENEEEDDMGLQLALKKARKLKQLESVEKKPDISDILVVSYFFIFDKINKYIYYIYRHRWYRYDL